MIPDTLEGLLAQIDAVDDLLAILNTHSMPGPVARVSVAPWTVGHLTLRNVALECIASGSTFLDEEGRETDMDGMYICTEEGMTEISIVQEQKRAYRLWDREGRELVGDRRGWLYVVSGRPK